MQIWKTVHTYYMETLPAKEERNYSTIKAEEASNKQTNITYPKD